MDPTYAKKRTIVLHSSASWMDDSSSRKKPANGTVHDNPVDDGAATHKVRRWYMFHRTQTIAQRNSFFHSLNITTVQSIIQKSQVDVTGHTRHEPNLLLPPPPQDPGGTVVDPPQDDAIPPQKPPPPPPPVARALTHRDCQQPANKTINVVMLDHHQHKAAATTETDPTKNEPRDAVDNHWQESWSADYALAMALQQQEWDFVHPQEEETSRPLSNTGKAVAFVEELLALQRRLTEPPGDPHWNFLNFANVTTDDMVWQTERLLDKQDEFRREQKPTYVDIGFHYTKKQSMERIKTDGLLTRQERTQQHIDAAFNGAVFGDGVYTADNPYSYWQFAGGDIGLFVLRLKGNTQSYGGPSTTGNVDTVLGRTGDTDQVTVLQSSAQCMAPVQFASGLVSLDQDDDVGNRMVYKYHTMLQELVDTYFNGGVQTILTEVLPSQVILPTVAVPALPSSPAKVIQYTAPDTLAGTERLAALQEVEDAPRLTTDCAICLESVTGNSTSTLSCLKKCGHVFHRNCIQECLAYGNKCPVCRVAVSSPVGKCPTGTMTIEYRADLCCSGHAPAGTIVITYSIPSGTQKSYHENPGTLHGSANRVAYVPDCTEGQELVKRLEFAFAHGLTFTVGVSLTTGQPNSVTWSSIHHKTSLTAGAHGYPDAGYFYNANEELDALDVPPAADL